MNMKRKVVQLGTLMVCVLLVFSNSVTFAKDYGKYWVNSFLDNKGTAHFSVNEKVTRAEFAALLSQIFGLTDMSKKIAYQDVEPDAWYARDIAKISSAGWMNHEGVKFGPNRPVTREEVAYAIVKAYGITGEAEQTFSDQEKISTWARESAALMVSKKYMNVKENNTFDPQGNLTRDELSGIIDCVVSRIFDKAGSYTEDVQGNAIINTGDVILKNMTISENLYISADIGQGDIHLINVIVKGEIILQAGMRKDEVITTLTKELIIKPQAMNNLSKDELEKAKKFVRKVVLTEAGDEITGIGIITDKPIASCNGAFNGKGLPAEESPLEDGAVQGIEGKAYEIYFKLPQTMTKQAYDAFPIQVSLTSEGIVYQFELKTNLIN